MSLIRIDESDDFVVDYDKERGMYRVSYFQDNHFQDEFWFDEYEDKEITHASNVCDGTLNEDSGEITGVSGKIACISESFLELSEDKIEYLKKLKENFDVLARC